MMVCGRENLAGHQMLYVLGLIETCITAQGPRAGHGARSSRAPHHQDQPLGHLSGHGRASVCRALFGLPVRLVSRAILVKGQVGVHERLQACACVWGRFLA